MPRTIDNTSSQERRTLVIQPLPGIGDMLWHLPALKAVARKSAAGKISILTKKSSQAQALLGEEPYIQEVLWLPENTGPLSHLWKIAALLRQKAFHEVWILHHSPRYALACYLAGIPVRYGYGVKKQRMFLNHGPFLAPSSYKLSRLEKMEAYFKTRGDILQTRDWSFAVSATAQTKIQKRFADLPKPWICLGIGASVPFKRWPLASFAELAEKLQRISTPCSVFLSGSSKESDEALQIQKMVKSEKRQNIHCATDLSLDETCALIQQSDYFIGNDSGLLNVSACLGRPSFGLFGMTENLSYLPHIIPVNAAVQPLHSMEDLTVDHVFEQVISYLAQKPGEFLKR